jgi:predicted 2-oxoglutarate/Fe(II)-dependent dioxygenase YbiX
MTIRLGNLFLGELLPSKTVAGCIDIFENAWEHPKEVILELEKEISNSDSIVKWKKAETIGAGYNQTTRTNYDLNITNAGIQENRLAQNIHNQMYTLLLSATAPYARKHDIFELYHEDYNILKYSNSQKCDAHADGDTSTGRSVSAIVYLNENYEGGEVEFVNFGVKIKPKPGMLLLFPSNYPYTHIAHPVTEGTKYAIVTWLHDRTF